jgi:hypothetical protein
MAKYDFFGKENCNTIKLAKVFSNEILTGNFSSAPMLIRVNSCLKYNKQDEFFVEI